MSSTNKTTNYKLSQYIGTDKPTYLGDYNSDMSKIDTQMKANANAASSAQSAAGAAQTKAESVESDMTQVKSDIEELNTDVSGLQNSVQQANTTAGAANSTAASANTNASQALTTANNLAESLEWVTCVITTKLGSGVLFGYYCPKLKLLNIYGNITGLSLTDNTPFARLTFPAGLNITSIRTLTNAANIGYSGGSNATSLRLGTNGDLYLAFTPPATVTSLAISTMANTVKWD